MVLPFLVLLPLLFRQARKPFMTHVAVVGVVLGYRFSLLLLTLYST